MFRRKLLVMLCVVMLFFLTETSGMHALRTEPNLAGTNDGYVGEVIGTNGNETVDYIDEWVDVITLPEDGSMPDYITYLRFEDGSVNIPDEYGYANKILDQANDAMQVDKNSIINEEKTWNICENVNIAFDLEVPKVTLFVSDSIASMSASDNIAVKSYEWYVDGSLVSSGDGTSSSITLNALGLKNGAHTVECRVYDAEGLAPGDRPRKERYGSASQSFQIVGESKLLSENISAELPELSPIENAESVVSKVLTLSVGEKQQQSIITLGDMDIVVQMATKGAIRSIDIISPDGKLYDTLSYIAPDAPYKISNAQAGEWTILISAFTEEDVAELPKVQGSAVDSQDTVINLPVDMQLQISLRPSPVEIDVPNITADSYILADLFADESIVVTENDQTLDKNLPLEDGIHELYVVREMDGLISEAREYSVTVDTTPPELSFTDLPSVTNRDRVVLLINCSEAMSDLMINGTSVELFDCGEGDEYYDVYYLDHGDNYIDITVTDLAGNSSSQTICVTRTS